MCFFLCYAADATSSVLIFQPYTNNPRNDIKKIWGSLIKNSTKHFFCLVRENAFHFHHCTGTHTPSQIIHRHFLIVLVDLLLMTFLFDQRQICFLLSVPPVLFTKDLRRWIVKNYLKNSQCTLTSFTLAGKAGGFFSNFLGRKPQ